MQLHHSVVACSLAFVTTSVLGQSNTDINITNYANFTDFTTWNLFGSASAQNDTPGNGFTYSTLQLTTPGVGGQGGAAFASNTTTLDFNQSFNVYFNFFIAKGTVVHGDGMTFVLSANNPATVSGGGPLTPSTGSDLGYANTGLNGLAFAIDTFNFSGEPVAPSIQILENDSTTSVAFTETGVVDISDPTYYQWGVQLNYVPSGNSDGAGTLTGTIQQAIGSQSYSVTATVDGNALGLNNVPLYYGFTAANGLADDGHFVSSAMPVPEPDAWTMLLAGLGLIGVAARRKSARGAPL